MATLVEYFKRQSNNGQTGPIRISFAGLTGTPLDDFAQWHFAALIAVDRRAVSAFR